MNLVEAKKYFNKYCDLVQNNYAMGCPSSEIVLLQECILQCISMIAKSNTTID